MDFFLYKYFSFRRVSTKKVWGFFLLLFSLLPETDGTFSGSFHRQRQFSLSFLLVNRFSDLAIVSQPATHGRRRRKERSMGLEKTLGWPTLSDLERKGKI